MKRILRAGACLALGATTVLGPPADASAQQPPIVVVDANRSSNWSGYNVGTIEKKGKLFTSITGNWRVPIATQHARGRAEQSSTWIGIGGGCVDTGCSTTDPTLIQTGTEQDVSASGKASYSAWWELVPAPSIEITSFAVHPGDRIHAAITETVPLSNVWKIVVRDVTTGRSFTQTVPYTSSHLTAEWIEETPLGIGTGGVGFSSMPDLSRVRFDRATVNGRPAHLEASERIRLADGGRHVATPSAPDPDADGFNDCVYASFCPAPATS